MDRSGSVRIDYYLFHQHLMGVGAFHGGESVEALKIIWGVNRPFRILLENQWRHVRSVIIASRTPHLLEGLDDWQVVLWIDPRTRLANLLESRSLRKQPWIFDHAESSTRILHTAGEDLDAEGAFRLFEALIRVCGGVRTLPATWDEGLRTALSLIRKNPGSVSVTSLADRLERDEDGLNADFSRVMGMDLHAYLHRSRWMAYIGRRHEGMGRKEALEYAGLGEWEALRNRLFERYGLDLASLESMPALIRVCWNPAQEPVFYV